jgi:uncharacterized ubiquitin-like protein YukD
MKVEVYDTTNNLVNTLCNVEKIVHCNDERYLISTVNKCLCCNQDVKLTTQVPANYKIEIKLETGDKVTVDNL